mgnify:CR=1 FL=1
MNKNGFLHFYVIGIIAGGIMLSSFVYFFIKNNSPTEISENTIGVEEKEQFTISEIEKAQETDKPLQGTTAVVGDKISTQSTNKNSQNLSDNSDEPPLLLKSVGVNLDYYDPVSNRAGDFVFTKQPLQFNRLFMGYGFHIPQSEASREKDNPQPTFLLPLGTPARSLVDGIVVNIPVLWSGDYSVQVTVNGKMEKWIYETEHIINPKVKIGDRVTAGQIVGEVSDFSKGGPVGFGLVEIGILKGGQVPQHVCPYAYLDPSIKQDVQKKIIALYKAWEDYVGDPTLYDESESTPGCLTLDPIDG